MATSPKLDFFRISLVPKGKNKLKTYRDFAYEVMMKPHTSTDLELRTAFLDRFMSMLASSAATDENSKKQVRWIDSDLNLYRNYKPILDNDDIIWGVLQGGRFGSNGLLAKTHFEEDEEEDDTKTINPDKSVLKYFYFMLFLPLDYREGCLIIHSNSRDESTSDILQRFIKYFLTGDMYRQPKVTHFCPKYLQDLFTGNAFVKQINLSHSFVDTSLNGNGICEENDGYKLQVIITPTNKQQLDTIPRIKAWLTSKLYQQNQLETIKFSDFSTQNVTIQNEDTQHSQSFKISEEDIMLRPVVDLNTILDIEEDFEIDGTTPKFDVMHQKVLELFINQVKSEIIPSV